MIDFNQISANVVAKDHFQFFRIVVHCINIEGGYPTESGQWQIGQRFQVDQSICPAVNILCDKKNLMTDLIWRHNQIACLPVTSDTKSSAWF